MDFPINMLLHTITTYYQPNIQKAISINAYKNKNNTLEFAFGGTLDSS